MLKWHFSNWSPMKKSRFIKRIYWINEKNVPTAPRRSPIQVLRRQKIIWLICLVEIIISIKQSTYLLNLSITSLCIVNTIHRKIIIFCYSNLQRFLLKVIPVLNFRPKILNQKYVNIISVWNALDSRAHKKND